MHDEERKIRHAAQMQRKKAVIDASISAASQERGLVLVNTGNGKGKSSAAFGVLARALGHGLECAVIQFIKNRSDTGEEAFFRKIPEVRWHVMGQGFTWETQDDERDRTTAHAVNASGCSRPGRTFSIRQFLPRQVAHPYISSISSWVARRTAVPCWPKRRATRI